MMNIILEAVHSQPNIFLISGIIMMTSSCLNSILLIWVTSISQLAFFLLKVFVKLFVNWLSLRENKQCWGQIWKRLSNVETKIPPPNSQEITNRLSYGFNKLVFIMCGAWIQDFLRGFRTSASSGKIYLVTNVMCHWQAFLQAAQQILFSWSVGCATLCWNLNCSLRYDTLKTPLCSLYMPVETI